MKARAQAVGGLVTVESDAGRGTRVEVAIPLRAVAPAAAIEA